METLGVPVIFQMEKGNINKDLVKRLIGYPAGEFLSKQTSEESEPDFLEL